MRKLADRQGVALILTISVLTAICILGLSFMLLLRRDQKQSDLYTDITSSTGVVEAAYKYGIYEIKRMSAQYSCYSSGGLSTYFGSTIESADSLYSLYFKNAIWATNAKLNLYQCGPEMNTTFRMLTTHLCEDLKLSIKENVRDNIKKLIAVLMSYSGHWKLNELQEIARVFNNSSTPHGARVYNQIQLYTTVYPNRFSELTMNVIDYGHVEKKDTAANNTLIAEKRNFFPNTYSLAFNRNHLQGAYVEIIAGKGFDPETPNINRVDKVDAIENNKLILKNNWPTGKEPDNTSTYKLYSYCVPLNFNAVDPTLLKSIFEIMELYCFDKTGVNSGAVMTQVKALRPKDGNTQRIEDYCGFDNFLESKCNIGKTGYGYEWQRAFIRRLIDPEEPKGFWNSTDQKWEIYPLPVPLCFTHNGYFDMDIQAGYKRNSISAFAIPRNLQKRKTTVKVFGDYVQTSRQDFEKEGSYQNWMCSSDWVPVRNMADYAGWEYAKNATFQNYIYSSENPNVIPDAIKTGLWLDFGAFNEGRGEDRIFSQITKAFSKVENIYSSDFFEKNSTSYPDPVLDSSKKYLEIKGTATNSSSGITLGKGSTLYNFGELGLMTRVEDLSDFTKTDCFPHPTNYSWYTNITTEKGLNDHSYADHKDAYSTYNDGSSVQRESWPPERWFTPTVFLRDDIDFRSEKQFKNDSSKYSSCKMDDDSDCYRQLDHDFSVCKKEKYEERVYHKPSTYDYIKEYRLNITLCRISEDNKIKVNTESFKDSDFDASRPWTAFLNSMSAEGKVGFKRIFEDENEYFPGTETDIPRPFGVYYLRIIPGTRSSDAKNSYYTSPVINLPKAKALKQVKVYYKLGLRKDASSTANSFTSKDSFQMLMKLALDIEDYNGTNENFTPETGFPISKSKKTLEINTFDRTQGTVLFDVSDVAWPVNPVDLKDRNLAYRITLENDGGTYEDKRFAYLNTTIAITKVELYYDSETEIFSSSDHSY